MTDDGRPMSNCYSFSQSRCFRLPQLLLLRWTIIEKIKKKLHILLITVLDVVCVTLGGTDSRLFPRWKMHQSPTMHNNVTTMYSNANQLVTKQIKAEHTAQLLEWKLTESSRWALQYSNRQFSHSCDGGCGCRVGTKEKLLLWLQHSIPPIRGSSSVDVFAGVMEVLA